MTVVSKIIAIAKLDKVSDFNSGAQPAPAGRTRRRRADADRSRSAILEAALDVLSEDPGTSVEGIAAVAGVTRQTVYAHFPSRDALLSAVADQLTAQALKAFDGLDLDSGTATDALFRLIDTGRQLFEAHPIRVYPAAAADDEARHDPVVERLTKIIRRGQRAGEFTRDLSTDWLVRSTIVLAHAAADLPPRKAAATLRTTLLRVLEP